MGETRRRPERRGDGVRRAGGERKHHGHLEQNLQQRQRGWIQVRDRVIPAAESGEWSPVFINEESAKPPPRAPNRRSFGAYFPPRQTPRAPRGRRPRRGASVALTSLVRARVISLSSFAMGRDDADDDRPASRPTTTSPIACSTIMADPFAGAPQRMYSRLPSVTFSTPPRKRERSSDARDAESPRTSRSRRARDVVLAKRTRSGLDGCDPKAVFAWTMDFPEPRGAAPSAASTERRAGRGDVAVAAIAANNPNLRFSRCTGTSASPTPPSCISAPRAPRLEIIASADARVQGREGDAPSRARSPPRTRTPRDQPVRTVTRCAFTHGLSASVLLPAELRRQFARCRQPRAMSRRRRRPRRGAACVAVAGNSRAKTSAATRTSPTGRRRDCRVGARRTTSSHGRGAPS